MYKLWLAYIRVTTFLFGKIAFALACVSSLFHSLSLSLPLWVFFLFYFFCWTEMRVSWILCDQVGMAKIFKAAESCRNAAPSNFNENYASHTLSGFANLT